MGPKSWLRGVTRKSRKPARQAPSPRRPRPLALEPLEDRTVPTVFFNPNFGPETMVATPKGQLGYDVLNNDPAVYIIFWGSYWNTDTGKAQEPNLYAAAAKVLQSTYLKGLDEYGSNGQASLGLPDVDSSSDPAAGYNAGSPTDSSGNYTYFNAVLAEIKGRIDGGTVGKPGNVTVVTQAPIYVVVTDPNHSGANGGYNLPGTYGTTPINVISLGTDGSNLQTDVFSGAFSHEMAERMTDPFNDNSGVLVLPPKGIPNNLNSGLVGGSQINTQIGDNEPDPPGQSHYAYRLGGRSGVIVQPYWSKSAAAFEVIDGNTQSLWLYPDWSIAKKADPANGINKGDGIFAGTYKLTIIGDQLPYNGRTGYGDGYPDQLTIDSTVLGTQITLNGESFWFDPGQLSSIDVKDLGPGQNTINIPELVSTLPVTIESYVPPAPTPLDRDAITVGDATHIINNFGPVTILGNGEDILTIDDSADKAIAAGRAPRYVPVQTTYTLDTDPGPDILSRVSADTGRLTRSAVDQISPPRGGPRPITLTPSWSINFDELASLTINGGSAQSYQYQLKTLTGANDITVNAASADTVTVGDASHDISGSAYFTSNTNGALTVNGDGKTKLVVDDSGNNLFTFGAGPNKATYRASSTQYTVNNGSLNRDATVSLRSGPANSPPTFSVHSTVDYVGLSGLTIDGGSVGTYAYQVNGTDESGGVTINAASGSDAVTAGGPTQNLLTVRALTVNGNGKTTLTVDDRDDKLLASGGLSYMPVAGTQYTFGDGELTRAAHAEIVSPQGTLPLNPTATFGYSGLASLTVDGGQAPSYDYQVNGTAGASLVAIRAASGADRVHVGSAAGPLLTVGNLSVIGDGGTTLTVDDAGDRTTNLGLTTYLPTGPTAYTVEDVKVTRTAFGELFSPQGLTPAPSAATFQYSGLASLTFDGGSAPVYTYQINGTTGAKSVVINASSTAIVQAGDATHNLDDVGNVTVNGDGSTTLTLDDEANRNHTLLRGGSKVQTAPTYQIDAGKVTRSNVVTITPLGRSSLPPTTYVATITYGGLTGLALQGGTSGNAFNLQATAAGTPVKISAGAGNDSVTLGGAAQSIDPIQSAVTVDGQGGKDTLVINDQTSAGQESYDVEAAQFTRTPFAFGQPAGSPTQTVGYSNVENLAFHAGTNYDVLGVGGTAAGTSTDFYGGSGTAEFIVTSNQDTLDGFQGPLALHGGSRANFAFVTDSQSIAGHSYTLTAGTLRRDGMAPVSYDGLGELIVATGDNTSYPPSPDTVNVLGTAAGTFTAVAVGGSDSVTLGRPTGDGSTHTLQGFQGDISVQSVATEAPTVVIDDAGDPATAARTVTFGTFSNTGNYLGGLAPAFIYLHTGNGSSVSVRGDGGDETFALQSLPPGVQLGIDGGGGVNTLDYSGWVGDVRVNLQLGTATGVDGGVRNIRNVTGSVGNDLLVGDANANVLVGGTGRNVILGGGGADRIVGGAGDNLLVGGITDYDTDVGALDLIMQEWSLASDFNAAVTALQTGGDRLKGSGIRFDNMTVHPDGLASVTPGPGNNWVIA